MSDSSRALQAGVSAGCALVKDCVLLTAELSLQPEAELLEEDEICL